MTVTAGAIQRRRIFGAGWRRTRVVRGLPPEERWNGTGRITAIPETTGWRITARSIPTTPAPKCRRNGQQQHHHKTSTTQEESDDQQVHFDSFSLVTPDRTGMPSSCNSHRHSHLPAHRQVGLRARPLRLRHQPYLADDHAFVHRLAHVVDRQRSHAHRHQGFHLDTGRRGDLGGRRDLDPVA